MEDPPRFTWNPDDQPTWERAYQAQKAHGLYAKLIQASSRKHLSWSGHVPTSAKLPRTTLDGKKQIDWGLTGTERLVINALLPSLSVHRRAARTLLENAWRAENGTVDQSAMFEAITASLKIAQQAEGDGRVLIGVLVGLAIRGLAYNQAIRAIDEGVFDAAHISKLDRWIARHDRQPLTWQESQAGEIALALDLLQFTYAPEGNADWPQPPRPNPTNAKKLAEYFNANRDYLPGLAEKPLDITGEIDLCDPHTAVVQLLDFHLQIFDLADKRLPQEAEEVIDAFADRFKADPENHVLIRQVAFAPGRFINLVARAEATRLIYIVHRFHDRTGKWPESLRAVRPLPPPRLRTDPFSGKEFLYRVENGAPLLYSAAANAKDDGGVHDLWWGESAEGIKATDYVFWPIPRKED